jgi:hypothetical protein
VSGKEIIEIPMLPTTVEEVSPDEYMRMDRSAVSSVSIRPPTLGSPGFGRIVVEYKTPIYRYKLGRGRR